MELAEPSHHFKPPAFLCDDCLGKHICEPYQNESFAYLCIGKPKSGKTSHLVSLLSERGPNRVYYQVFETVFLELGGPGLLVTFS